jgi:hypothetical protein
MAISWKGGIRNNQDLDRAVSEVFSGDNTWVELATPQVHEAALKLGIPDVMIDDCVIVGVKDEKGKPVVDLDKHSGKIVADVVFKGNEGTQNVLAGTLNSLDVELRFHRQRKIPEETRETLSWKYES